MLFRSGEERNLLVNYAYKFDNAEETEKLIRKLAEAKAIPDLRSATEICRDIQKEIEFLPDGMMAMTHCLPACMNTLRTLLHQCIAGYRRVLPYKVHCIHVIRSPMQPVLYCIHAM